MATKKSTASKKVNPANPLSQAVADGINTASTDLAIALSLLDMVQTRWEDHGEELLNIFGGAAHTDQHALAAIGRLVISAQDALSGLFEAASEVADAEGGAA